MENGGYVGYTGASSTAVSVVTDIAESLDISGTVNVSGTSLNNILTKNTEIDAVLDTIKVDTEAIETAVEAIQVDTAANEVLLTGIDAVLDTIKTDTQDIETAVESSVANVGNVLTLKRNVIAPTGGLDVNIRPSEDSYLAASGLNFSAGGSLGSQATTEWMAAPGAGKRFVIYGIQASTRGSGTASMAAYYFHAGGWDGTIFLFGGQHIGKLATSDSISFPYGVSLAENTAFNLTAIEGATQVYLISTVYYRVENT